MKIQICGSLEYEYSEALSVPHGFTTRLGGVSRGTVGTMNLSLHRGDAPENVVKNYEILGNALDFSLKNLVFTNQIHSDIIRQVTLADCRGLDHRLYPECDGLITNDPGAALVVFTADCTPVLLHDPVTGAVGAVHAGWRGTAAGIAGKAVQAMQAAFGCEPRNIRAAIGPNIGPCCFRTDGDVPQAMYARFGRAAGEWIRPDGHKFYVNLKALNALSLRETGVQTIDISPACTMCKPERYHSHRYAGAARGSQGAIIVRR